MRIRPALTLAIATFTFIASGQPDQALFHYADNAVARSEFWRVYTKNNPKVADPTEQDIRDYLELYINFKLKVAEAHALRIDTIPTVKNELQTYRGQLINSYVDKEILDSLVHQAYERMQTDVLMGHIQIAIAGTGSPEDTLKAYNKAIEARKKLLKGTDVTTVAKEFSDDQNSVNRGGERVYLTSMMHPYFNLEDAMYSLPVGGVSMPIRTRLGYHVIKVLGKRPAVGRMEAAHILIAPDTAAETPDHAKVRADSIYAALKADTSWAKFSEMAAKYSSDTRTASNSGRLGSFGTGSMLFPFDEAAFNLKNDGDMSPPVKTFFGHHIIKRISRTPIYPFEDISDDLRNRVTQDGRYADTKQKLVAEYKAKHGFTQFPGREQELLALMDSSIYQGRWQPNHPFNDQVLFKIGNDSYMTRDLLNYMIENQRKQRVGSFESILEKHHDAFIEQMVTEYGLAQRFEDFRYLKQEYHDGILLFALTERTVWNKATEDTAGLRAFYQANHGKYTTDVQRAHWIKLTAINKKIAKYTWKLAKSGMRDNAITDTLNARRAHLFYKLYKPTADEKQSFEENPKNFPVTFFVTQERGKFTQPGEKKFLDAIPWTEGVSKIFPVSDTTFVKSPGGRDTTIVSTRYSLVRINKVFSPGPKELEEARGYYIADYQDHLEKQWIADLRQKYPVRIDQAVLQTLFTNR